MPISSPVPPGCEYDRDEKEVTLVLMIKGIVRTVAKAAFFAAVLLLPAGTWQWPRAIQFLVVYSLLSLASTIALARCAPASLEARVQRGTAKNQPKADRVASLLLAVFNLAWFVFIPTDVFRLQLLPSPTLWLSISGVVLCLAGYGVMLAAVWQNAFAAPIVGDQSERDHVLIDTGLYGCVRHPMYLGYLLFLFGLSLWLESVAAAILVPLAVAPIVARILVEEKTSRESLPGYVEYTATTRSRLIPRVW